MPLLVVLIAAVWAGFWWSGLAPTVKPGDVYVIGILRPPGQGANLSVSPSGPAQWTLEMTLGKSTRLPLRSGETWSFQVTPYVPGMAIGPWDFMMGADEDRRVLQRGEYWFARRSEDAPLISAALRDAGVRVDEETLNGAVGWGYRGEAYPTRVRFYLTGRNGPAVSDTAVVYTHFERRWGKDLSWSVAFPVRIEPDGR